MNDDADEAAFLADVRTFASGLRTRFDGCPPPAAIRARSVDALPPDVAARLDAHLAGCHACRTLAAAFAGMAGEPDESIGVVPREDIWRRIERARDTKPARVWRWRQVVPYAMAASFLLIAGALTITVLRLQDENRRLGAASGREIEAANTRAATLESQVAQLQARADEPSSPRVNVPIVDLAADATRGAPSRRTIALSRDSQAVVFVLTVPAARAPSYALDVAGAGGQVRLALRDLRATPERTINLVLPRSAVPDGPLRLLLYGVREGQRERLAEYSVSIAIE